MKHWKHQWSTTLRPFYALDDLRNALKLAAIRLKPEEEAMVEERRIISRDELMASSPVVLPRVDVAGVRKVLGEHSEHFSLVATLRTPQLFRRELIGKWSLSGKIPEEIPISASVSADARESGLMEIGIAICLTEETLLPEGWPRQVGSWLSQKTFTIGIDRRQSSFNLLPLTEKVRLDNNLPAGAIIYAEAERLNEVIEEDDACAQIWLAETLLDLLRSGKANSQLQAYIKSEVIYSALEGANLGAITEIVPGSNLEKILTTLNNGNQMEWKKFKELVDNRQRLRALVHDSSDLLEKFERV